jgi:hypothetical protein
MNKQTTTQRKYVFLLYIVLLVMMMSIANSQPTGVDIIYNETQSITPEPSAELTTAGGTFTTLVLSGTFQTPRWKAYVGNVTGRLALEDSQSRTIYDWDLVTVSGQVYVTRHNNIAWDTISCASEQTILDEQTHLNILTTSTDSINNTFNETIHRSLFIGTKNIEESTCRAIATYVEDTKQPASVDATFQEILLQDSANNLIFTTIVEQAATGYDSNPYDFQLIVPENPTSSEPTTYYFYAEIY